MKTTFLWLLPILFMIHEFEEIIFINSWKKKQSKPLKVYHDFLSTESFTVAVFLEYMVISIVTLHAVSSHFYYVWVGLCFAVTFHYFGHIIIGIVYRSNVPGLITAILLLIPSSHMLYEIIITNHLKPRLVIFWSIGSTLLLALNLKLLHKLMPRFHRYITKGTD